MHSDWLLVADRLTSATEHTYRQFFGLHEHFQQVGSAPAPVFNDSRGNEIRLLALGDNQALESARGETAPKIQGWISHAYQSRVPRWSVASRVAASNATMVVLFATPAVSTASAVPVADTIEVTIESGAGARRYTVAFGQSADSLTE
jgi:hypothetical protein